MEIKAIIFYPQGRAENEIPIQDFLEESLNEKVKNVYMRNMKLKMNREVGGNEG